ncbi:hypothetical protein [Phormidesmis priestleyi]
MNEITKLKPHHQWAVPPPESQYPVVNHQGTNYQLVPVDLIEKLRADRENLVWFATGVAAIAIAAGVALVAGAFKPETKVVTIDRPVIVEREKVVPTNCLLFCGK